MAADDVEFPFLSGRLCLDLAATAGPRWRRPDERLGCPADLGRWLAAAGLPGPAGGPGVADLIGTRRLRAAVTGAATGLRTGAGVDAAVEAVLSGFAAAVPVRPRLHRGVMVLTAGDPMPAVWSTVAGDMIDLAAGPFASRVRECAGDGCGVLFVDTTPRPRRWCSAGSCGNRPRAAAFRARHASRSG